MLPGFKAALNSHPMFVHFPIVLWLVALFFELLAVWRSSDEMHRTAARLLYLGTLAGIITILTGLRAEDSIPPSKAMMVVGVHKTLMITATSLAVGLCMFTFFARKNFTTGFRKVLLLGMAVLAILVTLGADRGAQLVYEYGSAVNWPTANQQK